MSNWDWSKEDSDVVAVIQFSGLSDILLKYVDGVLLLKDRGRYNWRKAEKTLSLYEKYHGNRIHIRPEKEWTIYNNDLPFGELTDEQKGKLMVASLSCAICTSVNGDLKSVEKPSWHKDVTYRAKQPEPSMVDKFIADVPAGLDWREVELAALHMINEGWVKS